MGVLYLLFILLLRTVQNYCSKRSSRLLPVTGKGQILYMACLFSAAATMAFLTLALRREQARFDVVMIAAAFASGLMMAVSQLCMLLAMQSGTMLIVTAFSTAGLIVPCLFGALFLGERLTVFQGIGVLLFILASTLLSASARAQSMRFSPKTFALLIGIMLSNGATMLCQKLLTHLRPDADIALFSFFSFALPALIFGLFSLRTKKERLNRGLAVPILLLAAVLFAMNQTVTKAAQYVPSAILFTVPNAGNNAIAAAVAAIWLKEKLTPRAALGLICSILSTILVLGIA